MKTRLIRISVFLATLSLPLAILLIIFAFSRLYYANMSTQTMVSKAVKVDVSAGEVLTYWDTHGGFFGEGDKFVEIKFEDSSIEDEIKNDDRWKALPFSDNMFALLYGLKNDDIHVRSHLTDENGDPLIPEIKNGYYFFCDRSSEASRFKRYDESEVFDRASYNFTAAIYDADTYTLYYWEEDT